MVNVLHMPLLPAQQQQRYLYQATGSLAPLFALNIAQLYATASKQEAVDAEAEKNKTIAGIHARSTVLEKKYKKGSQKYHDMIKKRDETLLSVEAKFQQRISDINVRNKRILGIKIDTDSIPTFSEAETVAAANKLTILLNNKISYSIAPDPAGYAAQKGMSLEEAIDDLFSPLAPLSNTINSSQFTLTLKSVKTTLITILNKKIKGERLDTVPKAPSKLEPFLKLGPPRIAYLRAEAVAEERNKNQVDTALHTKPDPYKSGYLNQLSAKRAAIKILSSRIEAFKKEIANLNTPQYTLEHINSLLKEILNLLINIINAPDNYEARLKIIDAKLMEVMMLIEDCFNPLPFCLIAPKNNLSNAIESFKFKMYFRDLIAFMVSTFPSSPELDDAKFEMAQALSRASKMMESMLLLGKTDTAEYNMVAANLQTFQFLLSTLKGQYPKEHDLVFAKLQWLKEQVSHKARPVLTVETSTLMVNDLPVTRSEASPNALPPHDSAISSATPSNAGTPTPTEAPVCVIHAPKPRRAGAAAEPPMTRATFSPAPH